MKLVSAAGTGYFYAARKTKLFGKEKMILRKYDPRGTTQFKLLSLIYVSPLLYAVKQHVLFIESGKA